MNTAFKSMSDLVADCEDLLQKLARSSLPQVRDLERPLRLATDQLKHNLRLRAKRLLRPAPRRLDPRIVYAGVAALLAVGTFVWWQRSEDG